MGVPKRLDYDKMMDLNKRRVHGTATVANGQTSVTVTHGYFETPSAYQITITPSNSMGSATKFYVSDVGATTFVVNVNTDPGETTATFVWSIL
jgi:hypothetical protein